MNKRFLGILISVIVAGIVNSCAPTKVVYLQDLQAEVPIMIKEVALIKFEPGDQLRIMIHSRDPEIVRIFNLLSGSAYVIDQQGDIDMPVLGKIRIAGLTREQATNAIKYKLLDLRLVKDPVVTIEYEQMGYYLLGEVSNRGKKIITQDYLTLLEALSEAGDLSLDGRRDNVMVLRTVDGQQTPYRVNLLDVESVYSSPVFYIKQNDIIYVEPNTKRQASTTVNGTRLLTPSFWISMFTFTLSLISLISK